MPISATTRLYVQCACVFVCVLYGGWDASRCSRNTVTLSDGHWNWHLALPLPDYHILAHTRHTRTWYMHSIQIGCMCVCSSTRQTQVPSSAIKINNCIKHRKLHKTQFALSLFLSLSQSQHSALDFFVCDFRSLLLRQKVERNSSSAYVHCAMCLCKLHIGVTPPPSTSRMDSIRWITRGVREHDKIAFTFVLILIYSFRIENSHSCKNRFQLCE